MLLPEQPRIEINQVNCPFCDNKSGDGCGELKQSAQNNPMFNIFHPDNSSCEFSRAKIFRIETNFPINQVFISSLHGIYGIASIIPKDPYTCDISVSRMFDFNTIIRDIKSTYRTIALQTKKLESELKNYLDEKNSNGV